MRVGIVGLGKIARDQHLPTIARSTDFELVATASPDSSLDGLPGFASIEELVRSGIPLDAVAICTPPQGRHRIVRAAIEAGLHVLLEKPPGTAVGEVESLRQSARAYGVSLFAAWHSREAAAVQQARARLTGERVRSVTIHWKEDVRFWHPGQAWLWDAGGMGVFDPGINAFSIMTHILPSAPFVTGGELEFPSNCQAPARARLDLTDAHGTPIRAEFDFLNAGQQVWDILVETGSGLLKLSNGGNRLDGDGDGAGVVELGASEYPRLYARFAELIRSGHSDVDIAPLQLVADAFAVSRRIEIEPFHETIEDNAREAL